MPSPRKVSPSPSFSDSISSVNWRSMASGRLAGARPSHELHRLRLGRQRRDALALEGLLELAPLGICERAFARRADRLGAGVRIGDRRPFDQRIEDANEIRLAARVRLAVALDQAPAQRDLEGELR